jgi:hypothetical protein
MHMLIGMNIRIVYAYDSIFYVNTECEYAQRGTLYAVVYGIHLPSYSVRTENMLNDCEIIIISHIYCAMKSLFSVLKVVYSSIPFGYSQQTTMPLDRTNTSSILLFRCSISVMLPTICGRELL